MSQKSFHLRANAVRAEAQALMAKLRAERFASSRAGKRALRQKQEASVAIEEATATEPAIAVAPLSTTAGFTVSRKIQTATSPSEPIVVPPHVEEPVVQQKKPRKVARHKREAPILDAVVAPQSMDDVSVPEIVAAEPEPEEMTVEQPPVEEAMAAAIEPLAVVAQPKPRRPRKPKVDKQAPESVVEVLSAVALEQTAVNSVFEMQQKVEAALSAETPLPPLSSPTSARAGAPLTVIQALGPGMIWRLNQIGIHNLGDLAATDVEDLRGKLGPVARLVPLENWIAFARAS